MARERKLKKGPWSEEEINLLKELFPAKSTLEIADRLNRSLSSVSRQASMIGLSRKKEQPWSKEEIAQLKKRYANTSTWEIANQLDRPIGAIRRKALEMGLKKQKKK